MGSLLRAGARGAGLTPVSYSSWSPALPGACSTSTSTAALQQPGQQPQRYHQRVVVAHSSSGASGSNRDGGAGSSGRDPAPGGSGRGMSIGGRRARFERGSRSGRAKQPGLFEIRVTTPPPRSLGIYALPPLTHTGEEIEIDGQGYIVTALFVQSKLEKGRYVRWHHRLDVQPTGRYLLNAMLESAMIKATYVKPSDLGNQD